jgi:hypothetical protein
MRNILITALLMTSLSAPAQSTKPDKSVAAEMTLKQNLRDPDSYKRVGWKKYSNDLGIKTKDGKEFILPSSYSVWGLKYRAKNGFGGYEVEEQLFIFSPQGFVRYGSPKGQ